MRLLRAIRFAVTKGFALDAGVVACLRTRRFADLLANVSIEMVCEELYRAFRFDTPANFNMLNRFSNIRDAIFSRGLWLEPSLKSR